MNICPTCSSPLIRRGDAITSLAGVIPVNGHIHDNVNVASQIASCPEGHRFLIFFSEGCRVHGCSFGENIKRIEVLEELNELSSARERFLDVLGRR